MAASTAPLPTPRLAASVAPTTKSTVNFPPSLDELDLQPPVAPFMGKQTTGSQRPTPRTRTRTRSSLSSIVSFADSIFSTTSAETALTLPDPAEADLPVLERNGIVVISFDAGGIKGIHHSEGIKALQVAVNTALASIRRPPQPVSELVDLVLGTSVGALNAIAFANGSADQFVDMWAQIPTAIFKRSSFARIWGQMRSVAYTQRASPKRLRAGIVAAMEQLGLKESAMMANMATTATVPTVAVTTTSREQFGHPVYISSRPLRHDMPTYDHIRILDAASASASAPFYFGMQPLQFDPASEVTTECIDGAFGAANPAHPLDLNPASIGALISFGCTSGEMQGYGDEIPSNPTLLNVKEHLKVFAGGCTNSWVGAEEQRRVFHSAKRSHVFHRIPAPSCYDKVELDDYKRVPALRKASEEMFAGAEWQERLRTMAEQIVHIRYGGAAKV